MIGTLFEILDLNKDGEITRSELHTAAKRMGWHWYEAPIFALLDLLTIQESIPQSRFNAYMQQIAADPRGPYGRVLLNSLHFSPSVFSKPNRSYSNRQSGVDTTSQSPGKTRDEDSDGDFVKVLEQTLGIDIANSYHTLHGALETLRILTGEAMLLIIDPQRSFTQGVWMESIGAEAAVDVEPIRTAFNNCAKLLNKTYGRAEIMFTRCPFPPGSYDWDDRLAEIIDSRQLYFIKPGNSVLFPPFNGFKEWVTRCIDHGKRTLVIGGCTLNSCVRVSSIETQIRFKDRKLQVIVDLSLCGARKRNFIPSPSFNGLSAVESAVRQMTDAGVKVVRRVGWE
jgi:nicotinamidase-related amidase